ncbi:WD repeat-containing protein 17-like [Watersipora subatra]|uniref:WD repeat-containing protein 17-like n=1 Tax=Watersipora subatra TaxID=2589382 RepID=UPI00355AF719
MPSWDYMDVPVQLNLLEAGCQPWNFKVVAASGQRFAYCASESVYVYERSLSTGQYNLQSIIVEHTKRITYLCWHPADEDVISTGARDGSIVIWDVGKQTIIKKLHDIGNIPVAACFFGEQLLIATETSLLCWRYTEESKVTTRKEYNVSFNSPITALDLSKGSSRKVLVGHRDGTVSLIIPGKRPRKHIIISVEDGDGDGASRYKVIDLQFDLHSTDYALVISYKAELVLISTESMTVMGWYNLPSKAAHVQTIAWVPDASGLFVTGDLESGILRLWNVAKYEPLRSYKVKSTGFFAMAVIRKSNKTTNLSPTSAALCAYLACTFGDGGVGLYDLELEKWLFLREKGHVETVFDCKFSPFSCHRLATASYDGTVKVWDTSGAQFVCESSSPGNEGKLYQISWAPRDLNCIAVASSHHGVFVWNVASGRITSRYLEHGQDVCVYTVCWNQIHTSKILSGGEDNLAIVRDVDGSNVLKFKHSSAVFGCQWSPSNQNLFATGSQDGKVRIFHVPSNRQDSAVLHDPIKVFSGHTAKAFHIKWSPLREGFLASGSDDTCLRVWSYGDDKCMQVLRGHTSNVRGVCWSPEIAYLLYSGSWDYTIICWDIRTGTQLARINEHSGDIYGLSIHKDQPFILASSSRDSTVRLWSTHQVVGLLPLKILAKLPWMEIVASSKVAMSKEALPLLCGQLSSEIRNRRSELKELDEPAITRFHELFQYGIGVSNLFNLTKVILKKPESSLPPSYSKGIVHMKHLAGYKRSEANELEMAIQSYTGGQIGAPSKQERIQRLAESYLKLGNIEKYCNLMIENEEWERALSVAPAVSEKFWRSLLDRYTLHLHSSHPSQLLPFITAQRDPLTLVQYHLRSGANQDALLAAVAGMKDKAYHRSQSPDESLDNSKLILETAYQVAMSHVEAGQPILAACTYLSSDMLEEAISTLIRCNLLELAFSLSCSLGSFDGFKKTIVERLALRCERLAQPELAIKFLSKVEGSEEALVKLYIRNSGKESSGLEKVRDHLLLPSRVQTSHRVAKIRKLFLSANQVEGLNNGLEILTDLLRREDFSLTDEVISVLQYCQSVPSDDLIKHPVQLFDLLTMSCYLGGLQAIHLGYDCIVSFLLNLTVKRLNLANSSFPLTAKDVTVEADAWEHRNRNQGDDLSRLYQRASLTASNTSDSLYGEMYPTGSALPSYSDKRRISFITGRSIKGRVYILEDSTSALSGAEAIMWATVNPFSPISCGQSVALANKINPF